MDELTSLGHFKNKHGELFVVLETRDSHKLYIIGDETAWEPVKLDTDFVLSKDERDKVDGIVKGE